MQGRCKRTTAPLWQTSSKLLSKCVPPSTHQVAQGRSNRRNKQRPDSQESGRAGRYNRRGEITASAPLPLFGGGPPSLFPNVCSKHTPSSLEVQQSTRLAASRLPRIRSRRSVQSPRRMNSKRTSAPLWRRSSKSLSKCVQQAHTKQLRGAAIDATSRVPTPKSQVAPVGTIAAANEQQEHLCPSLAEVLQASFQMCAASTHQVA